MREQFQKEQCIVNGMNLHKFWLEPFYFTKMDQVFFIFLYFLHVVVHVVKKSGLRETLSKSMAIKGQLILKCPFGVFKQPKNQQKFLKIFSRLDLILTFLIDPTT